MNTLTVKITYEMLRNLAEWCPDIDDERVNAVVFFLTEFGHCENGMVCAFLDWVEQTVGGRFIGMEYYSTEFQMQFPDEKLATLFLLRWS